MDAVSSNIRKLIWPDHEGRLVTTIRCRFSAYVDIL
jgi:hypothetical protein